MSQQVNAIKKRVWATQYYDLDFRVGATVWNLRPSAPKALDQQIVTVLTRMKLPFGNTIFQTTSQK